MAFFDWLLKLISRFGFPRRSTKAVPCDKSEPSPATRADERKNVYPLF